MQRKHGTSLLLLCADVNAEERLQDWKASMILNRPLGCEVLRVVMPSNRPQECKSSTKPRVELAGGLAHSLNVNTLFSSGPFNILEGPLLLLIK